MTQMFPTGKVVATHRAVTFCQMFGVQPLDLVRRHARGDWGDVTREEVEANNAALRDADPDSIHSHYRVGPVDEVWVITDYDRAITTVLLPDEYEPGGGRLSHS